MDIQPLLEKSAQQHAYLGPRQILGVRIGLTAMNTLGLEANLGNKRLLLILETDGCFADGVIAATNCTVGHRTLRVDDYGKVAATLVDTKTGRAVRVAPALNIRRQACACVPDESRQYFAQMQAYTEVQLVRPIEQIVSLPGVRVDCAPCGDEIVNQRETLVDGQPTCRACVGESDYQTPVEIPSFSMRD